MPTEFDSKKFEQLVKLYVQSVKTDNPPTTEEKENIASLFQELAPTVELRFELIKKLFEKFETLTPKETQNESAVDKGITKNIQLLTFFAVAAKNVPLANTIENYMDNIHDLEIEDGTKKELFNSYFAEFLHFLDPQ